MINWALLADSVGVNVELTTSFHLELNFKMILAFLCAVMALCLVAGLAVHLLLSPSRIIRYYQPFSS
jgi:hypothetical protein